MDDCPPVQEQQYFLDENIRIKRVLGHCEDCGGVVTATGYFAEDSVYIIWEKACCERCVRDYYHIDSPEK